MDDAKIRVENELSELTAKIVSLMKFKYTETFLSLSEKMQYLMNDQLMHMMQYADILRQRLHIWGKTDVELYDDRICSKI